MPSAVTKAGDWSIAINKENPQRNTRKIESQQDSDDEAWRSNGRQKFSSGKRYVILGTASVRLQIGTHITPPFRAICDTGAQAGLITAAAVKSNALPVKQCARSMNGVNGSSTLTRKLQAHILPWFESNYRVFTELYVSDQFGGEQPWVSLDSIKPGTENLTLADPEFYQPAPFDILLAGDVWSEIIGSILYRHVSGAVMHDTRLGYVILGETWIPREAFEVATYLHETKVPQENVPQQEQALDKLLKTFFGNEDIPKKNNRLTLEEQAVEEHYKETFYRKPDGSYVIKIPFKPGKALGESRKIVMRRFYALEKRLQTNQALREKYIEFMREFIRLGHMCEAPPTKPESMPYYIPHHAISADKFRTVFDASCKTSNGESLNSIQMIGPKLQLDIQFQLMRFRRCKYAVIADVVKMFRQVGIHPSQWDLQRIFWREAPGQRLKEYQITVDLWTRFITARSSTHDDAMRKAL